MPPLAKRSIIWSFNFAIDGIVHVLRGQRNMRVHAVAAVLVAIASLLLGVRGLGLAAIVFAISLVFVTELLNTAIEATVDIAIQQYDPLAKIAKDVAAGAVLVAAINALVVAYLVLFEPAKRVLQHGLVAVRASTVDATVFAMGMVLLAVIVLKAISREGTWMEGGWPSGHAAVAFSAATIIGFVTGNAGALALGLFIAFLVVQSRVEADIHTIWQSLVGGVLGVLITTAVFQVVFW